MNKKIFYIVVIALILLISSCSKKTYIVGFDTRGGTEIQDQEVKKDDLVVKPNNPSKEGHTFIGWFVDGKEFDFNTKIENHLIIEAKWEKNEYTIKFVTNTDQIIDDITVKYNDKLTEPTLNKLEMHQFLGWYLNDELYSFDTPITQDITLVAKWEKTTFEIKFDSGFELEVENQYVDLNQKVTTPYITRQGYKFKGWYLNDELYDFSEPVTSDITIVAKWEIIRYVVKFNTNTDEEVENRFVDYGTCVSEQVITLDGYDLVGWYLNDELYDFSTPVTANITLSAKWEMKYERIIEELNNVVPKIATTTLNLFTNLDKCSAEFIWYSSNEEVISSYGNVARFTVDKKVTLTVTVLYSDQQFDVEFEVTVPKVELKKLEKGKIVSGYLADYGSFGGLSDKMIEQLDIINYSFGAISNGELKIPVSMNKELVLSYREKGVRVVLAIGGWGADGFSQAVRTEASRTKFINSIMEIIKKYQFDGIDIDWEYPGTGVAGIEYHSSDRNNLTLFCQELKQKMQSYRSDLILSIAIAPSNTYYDLVALNKCVDFFNLMTYDFAMGSTALHDSNLYGYTQTKTSMDSYVSTVKSYVDADKIIPGAAFYTRKGYFESESNQKIGGKLMISMANNPLTYKQLMQMIKEDSTIVQSYDETAEAAYIIHKRWFYSYDNPRSINAKCEYIKKNNLGGIMCWDLTNDYIDENGYGVLLNSMYEGMK